MNTAEKNEVIQSYMGHDPEQLHISDMQYNESWDALMPVWQKLRGELLESPIHYNERLPLYNQICEYIVGCDITTAHNLICMGIKLLNK